MSVKYFLFSFYIIVSISVDISVNKQPLVIESVAKYFNEPIEETKHKFCRYDAYSETTKYETKKADDAVKTFSTTTVPSFRNITEFLFFYYIVYNEFI